MDVEAGIGEARWYAKKSSRAALMLAAWASGGTRASGRSDAECVRVLTYHRFGDWPRDPFCVRERDFEQQVAWIAAQRLAVSLAQFQAFLRGECRLPRGAVLLTADDGAQSVLTRAAPILRRHAVPMVAFVPTRAISRSTAHIELPEPFLTWDEVGRLREFGIDVGSHGATHGSLGAMSEAQVRDEVESSRADIERELGFAPESFAYPYGTRAHHSDVSRRVLGQAGYQTVFLSTHGPVRTQADPLALPRIKVEGGEPMWLFRLLARGGMDRWHLVDDTLSAVTQFQRRRANSGASA